jgi:cobalamin biosynthesis protein CobD/CbiB
MAVGGAPLGILYKAINTMDSMVGYKNDKYLFFGRAAQKPMMCLTSYRRGCGALMCAAAYIIGLNGAKLLKSSSGTGETISHQTPPIQRLPVQERWE